MKVFFSLVFFLNLMILEQSLVRNGTQSYANEVILEFSFFSHGQLMACIVVN